VAQFRYAYLGATGKWKKCQPSAAAADAQFPELYPHFFKEPVV
jgi:hypothetical protein